MQTPLTASYPSIDELPISADQRAQLKALVGTFQYFESQAAVAQAQRHRASAAAELMSDNAPIGESSSRTAGLPSPSPLATATAPAMRSMVLIIAADVGMPERIAKAVAQELQRELLPVEIPKIVSKFIAETEKHLEEVFDVAGEEGNILFFDGADALFGRDGQASQSQFADQEVGYLLHHIEGFNGVAVLGIHAGTPVDQDVLRRFTCVIRA